MEDENNRPKVDLAKAGSMTLMNLVVDFAVDGNGQVLRYPDGIPISGSEIESLVNSSGRTLSNAEAAGKIVIRTQFIDEVIAESTKFKS